MPRADPIRSEAGAVRAPYADRIVGDTLLRRSANHTGRRGSGMTEEHAEQVGLRVSIVIAVVLCVMALAWGALAGSRVIIFDGVFMLLGVTMSGLSLAAARASTVAPDARFPFGRSAVTPLAIGVQGAALLGTLVYAGVDAVLVILDGGTDVAPLSVLGYGIVTAVASLAAAMWLRRHNRDLRSDLVGTEAATWWAGAVLSVVFALGAVGALLLRDRFPEVVSYTDPVLVLVACVGLAPVPIRLLRQAAGELLEKAPEQQVQSAIDRAVDTVRRTYDLQRVAVRATKLGDRLYVDVDFLVPSGVWTIDQEDEVRRDLSRDLKALGYDLWANIELTTDADLLS